MTGIFVASALVVALSLLALVVHRRRRRARATGPKAPGASLVTTPGDSPTHAIGPGPDDLVLVPLPNDTGQALIVGTEEALAVFEQSGLTTRETSVSSGLVPQLVRNAMASDAKEATDKFQRGANSGLIVQLAPETMEDLAKGKPVYDKAGNLLAQVRGDKGYLKPMHLDKAGAQVAAASNMATLAVTAALSQQLEAISEQLQEMSETLEGMVKDKDRERLSDALAANEILFEIATSVRRRGITQADYMQLANLKHRVTSLQIETTAKLAEIAPNGLAKMGRNRRLEVLGSLYAKERLEYWLTVQVQADLARTRCDLLTLLWEHRSHPKTAAALNQSVANAIRSRQARAAEVGDALRALSDPASQTRLDPVRVISRHQLGKAHTRIDALLLTHGDAFAGPERDPHTVSQAALDPAGAGAPVTALPAGGGDPEAL
ncbi:MAG: hypothetical protein M3524_08165 [Actinomycetota bacterium]|jgi:hypothetical protein|nr:hypothetical protein [Actinomycetota bacterium]